MILFPYNENIFYLQENLSRNGTNWKIVVKKNTVLLSINLFRGHMVGPSLFGIWDYWLFAFDFPGQP